MRGGVDEFDKLQPGDEDSKGRADMGKYMRLVGSTLWVANMTRPDVAYYCSRLAMYSKWPTTRHEYFALCVLGYLIKTKVMGITYGGKLKIPLGQTLIRKSSLNHWGFILTTIVHGTEKCHRSADTLL